MHSRSSCCTIARAKGSTRSTLPQLLLKACKFKVQKSYTKRAPATPARNSQFLRTKVVRSLRALPHLQYAESIPRAPAAKAQFLSTTVVQEEHSCSSSSKVTNCKYKSSTRSAFSWLWLKNSNSQVQECIPRKLCSRSSGCKIASFQFRIQTQVPSTQPAREEHYSSGFSTRNAFPQFRLKSKFQVCEQHAKSIHAAPDRKW